MAEDCRERGWVASGRATRAGIRLNVARYVDILPGQVIATWLCYAREQTRDKRNPPDERRAWAELVKELEGLG